MNERTPYGPGWPPQLKVSGPYGDAPIAEANALAAYQAKEQQLLSQKLYNEILYGSPMFTKKEDPMEMSYADDVSLMNTCPLCGAKPTRRKTTRVEEWGLDAVATKVKTTYTCGTVLADHLIEHRVRKVGKGCVHV